MSKSRERLKSGAKQLAPDRRSIARMARGILLSRAPNRALLRSAERTPLPEKLRTGQAFHRGKLACADFRETPNFWISLAVVIAALLSSVATFLILNGLTSIIPTNDVVLRTLGINALFVLAIFGIVGFQIVKLLRARKRQAAGAGLHFRIAGVFSLVALFPAILLAIFATVSIEPNLRCLLLEPRQEHREQFGRGCPILYAGKRAGHPLRYGGHRARS